MGTCAFLFGFFGTAEAALTYVGGNTATGNSASFNVSLTSLSGGTGSSAQEGDIVLVLNGFVSTANGNPGVSTSGFTEEQDLWADDTRDANLSMSWKIMTASPDTTVSCNGSGSATNGAVCIVHVWRGADQSTPFDVAETTATAANSAVPNPASITPTTAGAVVVAFGAGSGASADTSVTAPSGYGNQASASVDPGNAIVAAIASKAWTSGAEDPAAWSGWTTSTSDGWAAVTVALRPEAEISGTLYSDEGSTAITTGKTIRVAIGTTTPAGTYTTTSDSSGNWSINPSFTGVSAGTPIIAWVDNDPTTRAALVTTAAGASGISDLDLYKDHVVVRNENTDEVTVDDFATYDGSKDEDIPFIADADEGSLLLAEGQKLYVHSGDTFTGSTTTVLGGGIKNNGTLDLSSGTTYFGADGSVEGSGATTLGTTITGSSTTYFAPNGHIWTPQSAAGNDDSWVSVTYGEGLFVAVGSSGDRVMTSPDGITWTARSAAENDDNWSSVTYGNGTFVAVGVSGDDRVMTSPDGVTWTGRSAAGNDDYWNSVTYAEGLFVAVGEPDVDDVVMTSPDGITWTARSAAENDDGWLSVAYGEGQFIAVGASGDDRVMTSPDGITWTAQSASGNNDLWSGIAYGKGGFVVVGLCHYDGDCVMTSPDGITWTNRSGPGVNSLWRGVSYGNGLFVAVGFYNGGSEDMLMTSPDGITWTARTVAEDDDAWYASIYAEDKFVVVGGSGDDRVMTSDSGVLQEITNFENDGVTWDARSAASNDDIWTSVTYGNGLFVAVGSGFPDIFDAVMTSPDGITWTARPALGNDDTWTSVTYGNGLFVAVGTDSGLGGGTDQVMTSPDGITWTARTAAEANTWTSVTYGNGLFVAVSNDGTNRVMTSPDGITWTARSVLGNDDWWLSVTYGNGLFVAVAQEGTNQVMTSPDGITWTGRTPAEANTWDSVTYGNGLFVAVTDDGANQVMTSPDGITWTARAEAEASSWNSVTYGNGLFVAVALFGTNRVMTSPDGITWTARAAAEANQWFSVTFGNDTFVAVGAIDSGSNSVMTSDSGTYADTTQVFYADVAVNGEFTVTASSTVEASAVLTLNSDFTNNGIFTQSTGETTISTENNTIGYDLAGGSYDSVMISIADTGAAGLHFREDGLKMYTFGWSTDLVREFTLSSAWDLSTASQVNTFSVAAQEDFAGDLYFNDTGTKFYITADGAAAVGEFAMGTPWDVSTASYTDYLDVSGKESNPYGVEFSSDGSKMYVVGGNSDAVHQYNLGAAWDVSTGVFSQTFSVASQDTTPTGIHFTSDGTYMYMVGHSTSNMYEYSLSTPWDISTAVVVSGETYDFGAESFTEFSPMQVAFGNDGVKMYMYGFDEQDVFQFTTGVEGGGNPDTDKNFSGSGETTFADFNITAEDSTITFTNNFSASDFTIGATATVTAPAQMGVDGNFTNNGVFDHNDGLLTVMGNSTVSGSLTGTSALGNVIATSSGSFLNSASVWEEESAAAADQWSAITYGEGTFVAVSYDWTVMSSSDGVNWVYDIPDNGGSWQDVTYGNGTFVAVANTGTNQVMTSPDGINWTARSAVAANSWNAVTYGNGLFVAVACGVSASSCNSTAGGYRVMTSPDGITWTGRTASEAAQWMDVTFANNLFVAVAQSGTNRVMTSPDGITWTGHSAASANSWQAIAYGEGLFVAVSETDTAMSSPDGITWTARTTPGNSDWYGLAYGGGIFAAFGSPLTGSTYAMTSPDGITWTEVAVPNTNFFVSLTYGEEKFVAASTDGTNRVLVSSDGTYNNTVSFAGNASTTDLSIGDVTTVSAPASLSIADDYTNSGTFTHNDGTVYFDGAVAQTLAGEMVGTSTFNSIMFSGNSTKTFSANATTSDFTIASGATVAAPDALTIIGDYTNNGTFTKGSGIVYIEGTTTASTTITDAYDITTSVYESTFSVASQELSSNGLELSSDGTKLYVLGYDGDDVNQYALSTPWDITTASVSGTPFSFAGQENWAEDLTFSTDGTKMYILGSGNDRVFQYTLSSAWDVTTASYDSVSYSIGEDTEAYDIAFKPDGTKMFILGSQLDNVYAYTLSTPWVVSSASYSSEFKSVSLQEVNVEGLTFSPDGLYMFVTGGGAEINQYELSSAWDVSTASVFSGSPFSVASQESYPTGIVFNTDGTKVFIVGSGHDEVNSYIVGASSVEYSGTTTLSGNMTGTSAFNDLVLDSPQSLALDGTTWTARSAATNNSWQSLVYGEGLFVAVSNGGTNNVMTSPDGITWTARTSADEGAEWNSVTYGNGTFVAVAGGGTNRVMTSPDGITWTARSASQANTWYSVTYGNGTFVAVSVDGTNRVMTSPDGITWTNRTAAQASQWSIVTYGNSLFVALSWDGTIMTSPDGTTWTTRTTIPTQSSWHGIVYAEGLFVAVGNGAAVAMTSPDGITWTERSAPLDNWASVTHTGHTFVAVACGITNSNCNTTAGGNRVMTSPDGITWTGTPATEANRWMEVVYANGTLVAVSDTGTNRVMTSDSGSLAGGVVFGNNASTSDLTITASTTVDAPAMMSIAGDYTNNGTVEWGNGTTTLLGSDQTLSGSLSGSSAFNVLDINPATGSDTDGGTAWTVRSIPDEESVVESIAYGNGLFVAVGYWNNVRVMTSPDGINWTARSAAGDDDDWYSVTYANGLFVAVGVGEFGDAVMTSPDGINWTARSAAGDDDEWYSVTYGNGLFVAVGAGDGATGGDRVMTSPDGINWTARSAAGDDDYWYGITYGNDIFVAVAYDGTSRVMTSPDGINWTARSAAGDDDNWASVTYGNGLFVAVGAGDDATGGDRVMTSPDGITWTVGTLPQQNHWYEIAFGDDTFVAVAWDGTNRIITSDDGTNWSVQNTPGVDDDLYGVTYGQGMFVAAGWEVIMTSDSGSRAAGTVRFDAPVEADSLVSVIAGVTFEFPAYATSTFLSLTLDGGTGNETVLRSSKEGTQWGLDVTTQISVTYVDVMDSNACSGNPNISAASSTDSGNNNCWDIEGAVVGGAGISSAANQVFALGQATTAISAITITDEQNPAITAVNDIRIAISTSTISMLWDTSDTSAVFAGTAAGKVANPVSYEGDGSVLVIPVSTDFAANDTLVISGLSFTQFGALQAATSAVQMFTGGASDLEAEATDDKTITITGALVMSDHLFDQVGNQFSYQNQDDAAVFQFKLAPNGEEITVSELVLDVTGIRKLDTDNLTDLRLYVDTDANHNLGGGDTQIGGAGVFEINGQAGSITFSDDWSIVDEREYFVIADTNSIGVNEFLTINLNPSGITSTGDTLGVPILPYGSVTKVQHIRHGSGGGGVITDFDIPEGDGDVGGGGSDGGGGIGEEEEGETIGNEVGFRAPTDYGNTQNEWSNGQSALISDGSYTTATESGLRESYGIFGFTIPDGNTVEGIEVKIEASGSTAAGTVQVVLSWDGDSSVTAAKATSVLSGTDQVYTLGGPSDTWGRSWIPAQFSDENFFVRIIAQPDNNTVRVDAIQVKPYHQTGGGGGGGGGEI